MLAIYNLNAQKCAKISNYLNFMVKCSAFLGVGVTTLYEPQTLYEHNIIKQKTTHFKT